MKEKWLILVCLLMAASMAVGCAWTKALPKGEVPAEYLSLRMVGGSLGGESTTTAAVYATVLQKYYPEIEWSSCSGATATNAIYLTNGSLKLAMVTHGNYIDAYGFDKIGTSRLRSLNLPRAVSEYTFVIPEDKPWKDITEVPRGAALYPGTPGSVQMLSCEAWLKLCGLNKDDFKWIPTGKSEMADAWRGGKADIAFITCAGTSSFLMDMYTSPRKLKAMGLSAEQLAKAKAEQTFERIGCETPSKSMLTQLVPEVFKYDVFCTKTPNFLCCRDDFPVDIAYKMAKIIDEHHAELVHIYSALKFGATPQHHIQWARPPLDIHSGVAKYYREKGYLK